MNIHYTPNWREHEQDQSTIKLYFEKGKVEREVFSVAIDEKNISNPPFLIEANQKTFRAFAITPEGNAINLIKIDAWDFRWQETYQFDKFLHIPKNSVIIAEATFDNTVENPANPSSPPVDVTYGWNTTSVMFELVLYYLHYRAGDGE